MLAVDYLTAQNKLNCGEPLDESRELTGRDKVVVVIGGGDTGSDCVGTAKRQGAEEIYQLEILPKPPESPPEDTPWPEWPRIMRTSSSHEEGCIRRWSVSTTRLESAGTHVEELHGCEVEWVKKDKGWEIKELPGTEFVIKTDLVIVATGFLHVVHEGLIKELGLKLDQRGNILVNNYQTSEPAIFAAGDTVTGASLVAHAICGSARRQRLWTGGSVGKIRSRRICELLRRLNKLLNFYFGHSSFYISLYIFRRHILQRMLKP